MILAYLVVPFTMSQLCKTQSGPSACNKQAPDPKHITDRTDYMSEALDTSWPFRGQSLVGKSFGRLTAIQFTGTRLTTNGTRVYVWECRCECGATIQAKAAALKRGHTTSCGCAQKESVIARNKTRNGGSPTHGLSKHPTYTIWKNMLERCRNPKSGSWAYYGGRGIQVCEAWKKFENFWADMGRSWKSELEIDRRDVNGNYEPSNCRWVTHKEQCLNRRTNRKISFAGLSMTLTEWAKRLGGHRDLVRERLSRGWCLEKALTKNRRIINK